MTIVDRATRCFLWVVAVWHRTQESAQQMVNATPAEHYYSDQFPLYDSLSYRRGYHLSLPDKSETYSVEGDNAELRHYLTRLNRRSRCFSRSLQWLNRYLIMLGTSAKCTIGLIPSTRSMSLSLYACKISHSLSDILLTKYVRMAELAW